MRVLDLGCGQGKALKLWGVSPTDVVVGVDLDPKALEIARSRFPERSFIEAPGEKLPFLDQIFDRVVSSVALPYMDIPKALAELRRVLLPGGRISLSLHPLRFTLSEMLSNPGGFLFRLYVLGNGVWFNLSGRVLSVGGRTESFQTERGMRIALRRAGFSNVSFSRQKTPAGERYIVEAVRKEGSEEEIRGRNRGNLYDGRHSSSAADHMAHNRDY
jgi:ubiquinone/menaquinone biosynthesis C-methylase UbiE